MNSIKKIVTKLQDKVFPEVEVVIGEVEIYRDPKSGLEVHIEKYYSNPQKYSSKERFLSD
jgi:hypothetical protein